MRRYLALAHLPNGPRLLAGWLLVAPPAASVDLVVLLALHRSTHSFGLGGVAVAAGTIAFSVSVLVQGRLIDRIGIRRVLGPTAVGLATATGGLAVALVLGAAPALLVALTAVLGLCQPAVGPAVRMAWTTTAPDEDSRTTAFSYCTVTQDLGYVVGPALFGLLATVATPAVSLACCGVLIAAGALAISSAAAAPIQADSTAPVRARVVLRSVARLAAVMTAIGVALGVVDVSAPAFATQHRQQGLAGVLIAAWALGSVLGGLVYGMRSWTTSPSRRLVACTAAFGVLLVLPALATVPAWAVVGLLIAGAPMGVMLTTTYLLADEFVPRDRSAMAFSLLSIAINAGGGFGYALGGELAAHGSAANGFLFAAVVALFAALGAVGIAFAGPRVAQADLHS